MSEQQLTYVDVQEALELIGGYEAIYYKLVNTFLENQADLIEQIESVLLTNKDEARRLVHSCKGIAKNLGASPLYDEAATFEMAILENESDESLAQHLEAFASVFKQTFQELLIVVKGQN